MEGKDLKYPLLAGNCHAIGLALKDNLLRGLKMMTSKSIMVWRCPYYSSGDGSSFFGSSAFGPSFSGKASRFADKSSSLPRRL